MRSLLQVVRRNMGTYGAVGATSLQCKVQFCGTEFHIIAPFRLGIETKRDDGEKISAGRGVGEIENVLR
jgi:hypothetical protein